MVVGDRDDNIHTWKPEAGRSQVQDQPGLQRPCLEREKKKLNPNTISLLNINQNQVNNKEIFSSIGKRNCGSKFLHLAELSLKHKGTINIFSDLYGLSKLSCRPFLKVLLGN
jgi:hypothetical protein